MRRELHVRFCEGGGVRLPSATRQVARSVNAMPFGRRCIPACGVALPAAYRTEYAGETLREHLRAG